MAAAPNLLTDRPPYGLRPEFVHESEQNVARIREICDAILRYAAADKPVPEAWYLELQRRGGLEDKPPKDPNQVNYWDR